jgi:hypothetical protein
LGADRGPWARPRHELVILALVAIVAFLPLQARSAQDSSHFCLSRALLHGRLTVDDCTGLSLDRSTYGGHLYSNKAPGVPLLAIPAVLATGLPLPASEHPPRDWRLDVVRLFVSGLPFLLAVFLVGRVAEGLRRGVGGLALVAFGLGTLMAPFAAVGFDHAAAAAAGIAAFALAWGRRPLAAGALAGCALLCEYEAAVVVVALAVYVVAKGGRAAALRYLLGAAPGVTLLALYDWACFGAPWRNPLSYSDNVYRAKHAEGFLGVQLPNAHATWLVFFGEKGLLVISPVLAAAAFGLVLLWRTGRRAEVGVCAAVFGVLAFAECGYFDPYGGDSPGPRYLVAALPFLAVGLGPAFAHARRSTLALTIPSVVACVLLELTWTRDPEYASTFWGDVVHLADRGGGELTGKVADTALVWAGAGAAVGATLVLSAAAAALLLAAVSR